ncbi:MAG TPA: S46 family peptidase [Planctomycetota bacterium]|nr:S46 family peptidase [Planctomycetota bacterium]
MTAIISSTAPIVSTALSDLPGLSTTLPRLSTGLFGDEGMWLFNRLPLETLKEKHGFTPEPGWAERLQRAAVRLSSGGSGSFVSSEGLVMTNHHVGSDALQKLSTRERNLLEEGFVARTREEELKCPDLEVMALDSIEDVTSRVNAAVAPGADPAAAGKSRRETMATIEKESKDSTGLQSEVVTLYQGGEYHLYRYRRYDDVRLVMAPEIGIAFFGGDIDNFEFPRFDLDVCFFRIYQDGKPASIQHFLRWSPNGARDQDLVFVAGHPGSTRRLNTVDHFRFLRDVEYPSRLATLARREIALQQFSIRGPEEDRIARDDLFGVQNSRKALRGVLAGLLDPAVLAQKVHLEAELRARVAADPKLGASLEDWDRIAQARRAFGAFYDEYQLLEGARAFWSHVLGIARSLVRLAEENEKPNAERLPGYRESDRESLELALYSTAPLYPSLEKVTLADSLTQLAAYLGAEHPLTAMVLAGRSPADRANDLISGTKLIDVAARKEVAAGGKAAIQTSTDPMIILARTVDPHARAARRKYEDLIQAVEREAYAHISRAIFSIRGTSVYPDATFTLRLAYGLVKGWSEDGVMVPPFTTIGGAFEKHDAHQGNPPFNLPASWLAARGKLDLSTPFNFVCTADIIGGNSGSPVVNRKGEIVGIIFDGNVHSLILDISYTDEKARAVSVASTAIVEALRKVYGAEQLAREIEGKER